MKSQMQRKMVQIQHFPFILVYLAALITRSHILTTQAFAHHKYIFHTSESIINIDTNRHQRFQSLLSTRRSPQDDNIHQNEGIRLNKVFKATHSRREADKLIASGRVRVNGHDVIEKGGFKVIPFRDIVELDGVTVKGWEGMNGIMINGVINERLDQSNASNNNKQRDILRRSFEYIKYWKPIGVICTTDPKIKNNIIDAIHKDGYRPKHRIYPVGRLDKETSGLIILTSDGRLPNSVLRGEKKQPKIYHVTVDKPILDRDLTLLSDGIVITTVAQRDGKRAQPLTQRTKPCLVKRTGSNSFQITLVEGRNRQIRKMTGALMYTVISLQRTNFMGIQLRKGGSSSKKGLKSPGDWAVLDEMEMVLVENALGISQKREEP